MGDPAKLLHRVEAIDKASCARPRRRPSRCPRTWKPGYPPSSPIPVRFTSPAQPVRQRAGRDAPGGQHLHHDDERGLRRDCLSVCPGFRRGVRARQRCGCRRGHGRGDEAEDLRPPLCDEGPGKGTGMALVHSIVESRGGGVEPGAAEVRGMRYSGASGPSTPGRG